MKTASSSVDSHPQFGPLLVESLILSGMFFFVALILVLVFYWGLVLELMNASSGYSDRGAGPYWDAAGQPYWTSLSRLGIVAQGVWWTFRVLITLGAGIAAGAAKSFIVKMRIEDAPPFLFNELRLGQKISHTRANVAVLAILLGFIAALTWLWAPNPVLGRWALTPAGLETPDRTVAWTGIEQAVLVHSADVSQSAPGHVKSGFQTYHTLTIRLETKTGRELVTAPFSMGVHYRAGGSGTIGDRDPERVRLWSDSMEKLAPHLLVRSKRYNDWEASGTEPMERDHPYEVVHSPRRE